MCLVNLKIKKYCISNHSFTKIQDILVISFIYFELEAAAFFFYNTANRKKRGHNHIKYGYSAFNAESYLDLTTYVVSLNSPQYGDRNACCFTGCEIISVIDIMNPR